VNRSILLVLALSLAAPAVAGCAGRAKKTENFMASVRGYNEGVKWHRFTRAAKHLTRQERTPFLRERAELEKELRIVEWEILEVEYAGAQRRAADVRVRYTWHLDREGIVHETTATQTWELRGKRWIMAEEVRVLGPEMPGVAEPPPDREGEADAELEPAATPISAR
jgi:hypothetical protein